MSTARSQARRVATPTDLALIAGFAALVAAGALLPALNITGPVPITLQTLAVMLTGAVLGPKRAFLAVVLYLVVGTAGLPIFSNGRSGPQVWVGPSVGYIASFPFAAALCGFLVQRFARGKLARSVPLIFLAGMLSSLLIVHPCGVVGMMARAHLSLGAAIAADAPFWIGDTLKNLAMAFIAAAVHRAFPTLLPRRPRAVPANAVSTSARPSAESAQPDQPR